MDTLAHKQVALDRFLKVLKSIDPQEVVFASRKGDSLDDMIEATMPLITTAFRHDSAPGRRRTPDGETVSIKEYNISAPLSLLRQMRVELSKMVGTPGWWDTPIKLSAPTSEEKVRGSISRSFRHLAVTFDVSCWSGKKGDFIGIIEDSFGENVFKSKSIGQLLQFVALATEMDIVDIITSGEVRRLIERHQSELISKNLLIDGADQDEFDVVVKHVMGAWRDTRPNLVREEALKYPEDHPYRLAAVFDAMRIGNEYCYNALRDLIPGFIATRRYSMLDIVSDEGAQVVFDQKGFCASSPRRIRPLGSPEAFFDFGGHRELWRIPGEFAGRQGRGYFIVYDEGLLRAFPDDANSVWGELVNLNGQKVFVVHDIA